MLGRERVRELSQWLVEHHDAESDGAGDGARPRIGLQDSCHLRNGLGVTREPREVLARLGEYVELPSAGACCGAAGTYALLRAEDSAGSSTATSTRSPRRTSTPSSSSTPGAIASSRRA